MSKQSHFHDHAHAVEFDKRAALSDIRGELADRLIEAMELRGDETVLDVATGTGRFARPVSRRLPGGSIVGIDEALAMLRVSQESDADAHPPLRPDRRYRRAHAVAGRHLRPGVGGLQPPSLRQCQGHGARRPRACSSPAAVCSFSIR